MRLKVLLPTGVLFEGEVRKVIAEAQNGAFCLLPQHVDFTAALAPGLLSYTTADGQEAFVAVDEGVLVKRGPEVLVSTRNALRGRDLGVLQQALRTEFAARDERERQARAALAQLEADFVRRFVDGEDMGA